MLFNSIEFLVFFPVVTILYFLLPQKWRWLHLLVASCVFYAAFIPSYLLILFFTIVVDYFAGIFIENASGHRRKLLLGLSVVVNVGFLGIFKYYNFFIGNVNDLLHHLHITATPIPYLNIILPIGLSFHTFQAMSYTIEVYRGHQKAERHFGIYALYVMFYPQLVAGPIERPQNMLHQFHEPKFFNYDNISDGLKFMLWGMFKKVVIADRLAQITDPIFNNPEKYTPIAIAIAAIFFSFQIFCDFSGYSDIAIGAARVMGFKLMQNFNRPYHSRNIAEFWKRWHISLSTWFRDYLYISIGGNRVSVPRWYFNLFFVFLVSGLWHGANWTFIAWGALHGFYLVFALVSEKSRNGLRKLFLLNRVPFIYSRIQVFTTFCLVTLAWVFFRANSVKQAVYIIGKFPAALNDLGVFVVTHKLRLGKLPVKEYWVFVSFALILFLEFVHYMQLRGSIISRIKASPAYVRWAVYYMMVITILVLGVFENRKFIYFQF